MTVATPGPLSPRSGIIDVWRAFACLAVVAFHAAANYAEPDLHPAIAFLNLGASHGHLGVLVFFVISGYCLARAIERHASRGLGGPLAFWRDRVLRIFPSYWAAFALAVGLALLALPFNGLTFRPLANPDPLFWLSNLFLATEWTGARAFLGASWSLDHEAGFYLLVGLALLLPAANRSSRFACYALITAAAHLPAVADHLRVLSLWPAFACGLAARFALDPTLPRALRVSALLYPATLLVLSKGEEITAPIAALLLVLCLANEFRLPAMPRALLHLGTASYSIYLVHIPVMSPAANLARRFISPASISYLAVWIGQVVLGIAAGLFFFRAVELRAETLRARLRPHASLHP